MRRATFFLALLWLSACGSEEPVPEQPTWINDVEPILRGNCFHCHGAGNQPNLKSQRWDFYFDPNDPKLKELGADVNLMAYTVEEAEIMSPYLRLDGVTRMPPPPATRL